MENDRVAATRAVQQNTQLKQHVAELQEALVRLNNEKLDLTEKWQHSEYVSSELSRELKKYKGKQEIEFRDAVAQCTVVFYADHGCQASIDDIEIPTTIEHITPEAVGLLEKKLKKTMNDYANLFDEKQRLEHLVLHLQSETETIGEYVTLYQNQRSLLQERAMERDRQMAAIAKEREELKLKLAEISSLLPQVIQHSGATPVHSTQSNGVAMEEAPASKIKTLLTEIETSSLVKDMNHGIQSNFHPCLLCSGKLITI
uniref:Putative golgin subfamily protein a member n=1 Tax=Triatoma dimidiata TaxID=72491 RepID=A0A0V0G7Y0_TRIDM